MDTQREGDRRADAHARGARRYTRMCVTDIACATPPPPRRGALTTARDRSVCRCRVPRFPHFRPVCLIHSPPTPHIPCAWPRVSVAPCGGSCRPKHDGSHRHYTPFAPPPPPKGRNGHRVRTPPPRGPWAALLFFFFGGGQRSGVAMPLRSSAPAFARPSLHCPRDGAPSGPSPPPGQGMAILHPRSSAHVRHRPEGGSWRGSWPHGSSPGRWGCTCVARAPRTFDRPQELLFRGEAAAQLPPPPPPASPAASTGRTARATPMATAIPTATGSPTMPRQDLQACVTGAGGQTCEMGHLLARDWDRQ